MRSFFADEINFLPFFRFRGLFFDFLSLFDRAVVLYRRTPFCPFFPLVFCPFGCFLSPYAGLPSRFLPLRLFFIAVRWFLPFACAVVFLSCSNRSPSAIFFLSLLLRALSRLTFSNPFFCFSIAARRFVPLFAGLFFLSLLRYLFFFHLFFAVLLSINSAPSQFWLGADTSTLPAFYKNRNTFRPLRSVSFPPKGAFLPIFRFRGNISHLPARFQARRSHKK